MISRSISAGIAAAILASPIAASAADLNRGYKAPSYVAPVAGWGGFYAGLNAGYGFGSQDATADTGPGTLAIFGYLPRTASVSAKGIVAGGQLGYNYQFGSFLLGAEADLDYSAIKGTGASTPTPVLFGSTQTTFDRKMDYFGTLRGRAGYVITNSLLLYVTGGLAFGHVKDTASINVAPFPAGTLNGETSKTKFGWTLGGGVEWAVWSNWTVKGEYLYYDLGSTDVAMTGFGFPIPPVAHFKDNGHLVRLGVNYRF